MKTFFELREGYAFNESLEDRIKADVKAGTGTALIVNKHKNSVKNTNDIHKIIHNVRSNMNKNEDSDAVKAFLAKGGKIKKLPPAKAQGYHGKDDPGKGMHGMLDRPDTKKIGTRKKVKSMEATQVDEISKDTKKSYIKKAADDMSKQADRMARAQRGDGKMDKAVNKFVNRRKGIARAVENYQVQQYKDGKKVGSPKSFGGNLKKATAHASKMGNDHRVHKENSVDEQGAGLWANIRAKRARGERMRKPGEKGAPTQDALKRAQGK